MKYRTKMVFWIYPDSDVDTIAFFKRYDTNMMYRRTCKSAYKFARHVADKFGVNMSIQRDKHIPRHGWLNEGKLLVSPLINNKNRSDEDL